MLCAGNHHPHEKSCGLSYKSCHSVDVEDFAKVQGHSLRPQWPWLWSSDPISHNPFLGGRFALSSLSRNQRDRLLIHEDTQSPHTQCILSLPADLCGEPNPKHGLVGWAQHRKQGRHEWHVQAPGWSSLLCPSHKRGGPAKGFQTSCLGAH